MHLWNVAGALHKCKLVKCPVGLITATNLYYIIIFFYFYQGNCYIFNILEKLF